MRRSEDLKKIVKEKYAEIAGMQPRCGCGCGSGQQKDYSVFSEDYRKQPGYMEDADLGLGCGLPTEYAGCVSGAMQKSEYLDIIRSVGFKNIQIKSDMKNIMPDYLLLEYLTPEEISAFRKSGTGIYSITVTAEK